MGSHEVQGKIWGKRTKDWADIQEAQSKTGYEFVLNALSVSSSKLLDIGCGTGYFCKLAVEKGADVTGLDATPDFIDEAKIRVPAASFFVGEMEELPFEELFFDVVCGFNSFQYSGDIETSLMEAKRVLADDGKLVIMIWGNQDQCEIVTLLNAIGSLLPFSPSGTAAPFSLSENQQMEQIISTIGFNKISSIYVPSSWDYPNEHTALKGLLSLGAVAKAVEHSGFEKVNQVIKQAIQPYIQQNGHVVYRNQYKIIIAEK